MDFPAGLRIVGPQDATALLAFCEIMHADNGLFPMSRDRVQSLIDRACEQIEPPCVIAIAEGPDGIEAAICLDSMVCWYSDQWYWGDRFIFVHPAFRRSRKRHADRLIRFALWWNETAAMPAGTVVVIGIETLHELSSKERLYSRYARRIGGSYLIGAAGAEVPRDGQRLQYHHDAIGSAARIPAGVPAGR